MKIKFSILAVGLRLNLENSLAIIVACAVLHINQNEGLPSDTGIINSMNLSKSTWNQVSIKIM